MVRDLAIGASNSWCLSFDNLSRIPSWLSDTLCRMSTGGGFATRELFSDQEEILFEIQRPVILTSIEEIAPRSDLLDRCLVVSLPPPSRKTSAFRNRPCSGNLNEHAPAFWGLCLMPFRRPSRTMPWSLSRPCRAWPTSQFGSRLQSPDWDGLQGRFSVLTGTT